METITIANTMHSDTEEFAKKLLSNDDFTGENNLNHNNTYIIDRESDTKSDFFYFKIYIKRRDTK